MPTQSQIDQEERDLALARQLQAEEEARQQPRPAPPQQQQQQQQMMGAAQYPSPSHPPGTTITLSCPACRAINHIVLTQQSLQHMCGNCHRLLPPVSAGGASNSGAGGAGLPRAPMQGARSSGGGGVQMRCPSCGTVNQVNQLNANGPTQFLCGNCKTMLTVPAPSGGSGSAAGGGDGVAQGVLVQKVRCGRCQAVNAVKGASGTQFKCGSCGSINEVP